MSSPKVGIYDFGDDDSSTEGVEVMEIPGSRGVDRRGSMIENDEGWSDGDSQSTSTDDDSDESPQHANDQAGYAPSRPSVIQENEYDEASVSTEEEVVDEEEYEEEEVLSDEHEHQYTMEEVEAMEGVDFVEDPSSGSEFHAHPLENYSIMDALAGGGGGGEQERPPPSMYQDSFADLVNRNRDDNNVEYDSTTESGDEVEDAYSEEDSREEPSEEESSNESSSYTNENQYTTGPYAGRAAPAERGIQPISSFHTSPEVYEAPDVIYEEHEESTEPSDDMEMAKSFGEEDDVLDDVEEEGSEEESEEGEEEEESDEEMESTPLNNFQQNENVYVVRPPSNHARQEQEDMIEISTDDEEDSDEQDDSYMEVTAASSSQQLDHIDSDQYEDEHASGEDDEEEEDEPDQVFSPKEEKKRWGFFGRGSSHSDNQNKKEQPVRGHFVNVGSGRHLDEPNNSQQETEADSRPLFATAPVAAAPLLASQQESTSPDSLQDVSEALEAENRRKRNNRSSSRGDDNSTLDDSRDGGRQNQRINNSSRSRRSTRSRSKDRNQDPPMLVGGISDDEFEDEHNPNKSRKKSGVFGMFGSSAASFDSEKEQKEQERLQRKMAMKASQPEQSRYDEEMAVIDKARVDKEGDDRQRKRNRQTIMICLCLAIIIIGGSFGTAYWGTKLALDRDDDGKNNGNATTARDVDLTSFSSSPTPVPAPTPSPTPAPTPDPVFTANNTIGCPGSQIPLELIMVFDNKPREIGIYLRDSGGAPIWNFGHGTFVSFSQFLRENYFMVCIVPGLAYELEITDTANDGLTSQLLQQPLYGKFSFFYGSKVMGTYDGDCDNNEANDCGTFCSCKYTIDNGQSSGVCTNDCST